jgi:hypothetical protein
VPYSFIPPASVNSEKRSQFADGPGRDLMAPPFIFPHAAKSDKKFPNALVSRFAEIVVQASRLHAGRQDACATIEDTTPDAVSILRTNYRTCFRSQAPFFRPFNGHSATLPEELVRSWRSPVIPLGAASVDVPGACQCPLSWCLDIDLPHLFNSWISIA